MGSEIETAVEVRSIAVLHLCMQVCFRSLGFNLSISIFSRTWSFLFIGCKVWQFPRHDCGEDG